MDFINVNPGLMHASRMDKMIEYTSTRCHRPAMWLLACLIVASGQAQLFGQSAWELLPQDDNLRGRHEHGYVAVGDQFYLVGGRGERPVQAYDLDTGTWETLSGAPIELHHFQAAVHDDKIYVMGAFTGGFPRETPVGNIYIYDPSADTWSVGAEIPEHRRRGAAGVVVHDDRFYIVAGITNGHNYGHVQWLDSYDPATNQWTELADAPRARDHFQAVVLDGNLYAAGGRRSSFATGEPLQLTIAEVDVYDFETDTWSTLPESSNIPTQRAGAATVVLDGRLIVIGGESGRDLATGPNPPAHNEVEALDPATHSWMSMAPLRVGRHGIQAVVHENMIYVASGSRTIGANDTSSHEVYVSR